MHRLASVPNLPAEAVDVLEQAAERAGHARAPNTLRAYRADLADYEEFCAQTGFPLAISAPIVAAYLDQLARRGAKVSTITRRLAALNAKLRSQQLPALSLREEPLASVVRGIRRQIGDARDPAKPLEIDALREAVTRTPEDLGGLRDRAALLMGFAGALRRSELVGLDWGPGQSPRATDDNPNGATGHIELVAEGLLLVLYRSKTNQTGAREEVAICRGAYEATCAVRALEAWRAAIAEREGEAAGPVFRSVDRHGRLGSARLGGKDVARLVKRAAIRAALAAGASKAEAEESAKKLSGHSLRSGFVTTAFLLDHKPQDVQRQTRHRDINTLLGYHRPATAFVANVSGRIGL